MTTNDEQRKLRITFIHPDLGLGGAERLVVDAALGLQKSGHTVSIHTSHHDPGHCFDETRDGTLRVVLYKPPFFLPRSFHGKFHIVFAHLRQLHLAWHLIRELRRRDAKSSKNVDDPLETDVFFMDQLSTCLPLLRLFTGRRVLFYCHFPDKLIASGEYIDEENEDSKTRATTATKRVGLLKRLYRFPMDYLEEKTTAAADLILVNSLFTSRVFKRHFSTIHLDANGYSSKTANPNGGPRVVYPGINMESYDRPLGSSILDDEEAKSLVSPRPTFVSLNRFEKKKNVALAVEAFSRLLAQTPKASKARLVLAGGYDSRLEDNVECFSSLLKLIASLKLTWCLAASSTSKSHPEVPQGAKPQVALPNAQVILLPNFTTAQRSVLLKSESTLALLYTPMNEHFGIVPVEAMACGVPVLACRSGGPMESVPDPQTDEDWTPVDHHGEAKPSLTRAGWLRKPDADEWAEVMGNIVALSPTSRQAISTAAKARARNLFSMETMAQGMERALYDIYRLGPISTEKMDDRMMDFAIWGYMVCVIISFWFLGGAWTMGWTAVLLATSAALKK